MSAQPLPVDEPEESVPQPSRSASVDLLTAEVRAVMIGNRQVTLSVYRQLDTVPYAHIEAWGRVRPGNSDAAPGSLQVIGRHRETGVLSKSTVLRPPASGDVEVYLDGPFSDWFVLGPARDIALPRPIEWRPDLPVAPQRVQLLKRGDTQTYVSVPTRHPQHLKVLPELTPGSVTFASSEAKVHVLNESAALLDEIEEGRHEYAEVEALPLIVLAGIR